MVSCRLVVHVPSLISNVTIFECVNLRVQYSNTDCEQYSYVTFDKSQIKLHI